MREFLDRTGSSRPSSFSSRSPRSAHQFGGMTTAHLAVLPGQLATVRVTASAPFSYKSDEKPAPRRSVAPSACRPFIASMPSRSAASGRPARTPRQARRLRGHASGRHGHAPHAPGAHGIVDAFNSTAPYNLTSEDVAALLTAGDAKTRAAVFETGLATLRDLYAEGVADNALAATGPGSAVVFQIAALPRSRRASVQSSKTRSRSSA